MPYQYKRFLLWSNGGEGKLGDNYIYIWAIEDIVAYNNDYGIHKYLQKEYSKIKSCSEIDREVLEEFLIHLSTKDTSHSANSSYVISLRRQLETIGKI